MRGQTELPALAVAFVVLTTVVVLGVTVATGELTAAERPAVETQTATGLSERLVEKRGPLTTRANVVDADAVDGLNASVLRDHYDLPSDTAVRIRLGGETVVAAGTVSSGTTVERLVLVERRTRETIRPEFDSSRTTTLPRRTSNATLTIAPQSGTTVEQVLANGRPILANDSGLNGTYEVALSALSTTTLRFETTGPLTADSVQITYLPPETEKAILRVTVDV